jgi:hypothetical protein
VVTISKMKRNNENHHGSSKKDLELLQFEKREFNKWMYSQDLTLKYDDADFMSNAIFVDFNWIIDCSLRLKKDKDFVLKIIQYYNNKYNKYQAEKTFILKVIPFNNDKDVVKCVLDVNPKEFEFASLLIRGTKPLALYAIEKYYLNYYHLEFNLDTDKDIMIKTLSYCSEDSCSGILFRYLLKSKMILDPDIFRIAFAKSESIIVDLKFVNFNEPQGLDDYLFTLDYNSLYGVGEFLNYFEYQSKQKDDHFRPSIKVLKKYFDKKWESSDQFLDILEKTRKIYIGRKYLSQNGTLGDLLNIIIDFENSNESIDASICSKISKIPELLKVLDIELINHLNRVASFKKIRFSVQIDNSRVQIDELKLGGFKNTFFNFK